MAMRSTARSVMTGSGPKGGRTSSRRAVHRRSSTNSPNDTRSLSGMEARSRPGLVGRWAVEAKGAGGGVGFQSGGGDVVPGPIAEATMAGGVSRGPRLERSDAGLNVYSGQNVQCYDLYNCIYQDDGTCTRGAFVRTFSWPDYITEEC